MGSPVCGFRPTRALRCAFTRRPRPGTTNTPFFLVSFTATSASSSKNAATVLLGSSTFSAICRTSWVLVKPAAMFPPWKNSVLIPAGLILYHCPVENTHILRGFRECNQRKWPFYKPLRNQRFHNGLIMPTNGFLSPRLADRLAFEICTFQP